tara:strand:- start:763 stop:1611 length:849 start_codon:yes stop_codon:yes gene_type:complete
MKNIILTLICCLFYTVTYGQCTPNPAYQNSTYNIWPDTVQNLPHAIQGIPYTAVMDIKTPATLIEATGGDSSITVIDTNVLGFNVNQYIGDWPVDSMELVSLSGLPSGLNYGCDITNCVLPGNTLTCAYINGTTNDPVGVYPLTILVNVYTHGVLDLGLIQYPLALDLYGTLGYYEQVPGYKVMVDATSNVSYFHESEFKLFQNTPNPYISGTEILFNIANPEVVKFYITDILGKIIYEEEFSAQKGVNKIEFKEELENGMYFYSIKNKNRIITKRMIVRKS